MQWVRLDHPGKNNGSQYRRALGITLLGNIALAIGKGLAAYVTGSAALFADAANSISDVFYSIMMVWGLWISQQPPDRSHPQGHSRFEPLVGMTVTLSMTLAGYQAAREAINRFIVGSQAIELGIPVVVLTVSALVKAVMFIVIRRLANQIGSPALRVSAIDNLSDVMTSLAAFLGILGSNLVTPLLDPAAGLVVAVWIFRNAFIAGRENLSYLTGAAAPQELNERIVAITESVPGVLRVHHLMSEYVGPTLVVDLHVNMQGQTPLIQTHAVSDQITQALQSLPEIDRAYVHIEPDDWED